MEPAKSESPLDPVVRYFQTLKTILLHPTDFFKSADLESGMTKPLVFGLITHWIGAAFEYMGNLGTISQYQNEFKIFFNSYSPRMNIKPEVLEPFQWLFGMSYVILDPFFTLIGAFSSAAFVWIALKFLVTPKTVEDEKKIQSYPVAVSVLAFALAPSVFSVIPVAGPFIAGIGVVIYSIIGVKTVYEVSSLRAFAILFLPKIILGFLSVFVVISLVIVFAMLMAITFAV